MTENQQVEQGERLKKIRKDLDLDQISFSKMLEIDQSQYSRTERGILAIQLKQLLRIVELGYNLNWLIADIGEMKLPEGAQELPMAAEQAISYEERKELDRLRQIEVFLKEKFPDFNGL